MNLFQALILSIIEGITEFLPISSTGHMVLASKLLAINQTDFVKSFEIVIQLGAILSVIVLYGLKILNNKELLKKTLVAFIPTGIVGLLLYKIIKQLLIGNMLVTVISLFLGGIAIIILEKYFKNKQEFTTIENLSYKRSFLIGIFQSISVVPGVSRAAATIFGGLFMGLDRKSAVEFSFILAIPTMAAATGLDLIKSASSFSLAQSEILAMGFIGSFIVALLTVKWLLNYVKSNTFIPFGIYRIILAIFFFPIIK